MIYFNKDEDFQLDFSDVLLVPKVNHSNISSRSQISLESQKLYYKTKNNLSYTPIIAANMDSIGTFEMARHLLKHKIMVAILKDYSVKDWESKIKDYNLSHHLLIPTLGTNEIKKEIEKLKLLTQLFPNLPFVCLDVANGYLKIVSDSIKELKDALPEIKICAGNIVDEHGVEHLSQAGADIIKVGIGSGGVCLTRKKTGIGYPQFSAINNIRSIASDLNVMLISDGGTTCPGDFVKAFAAGSDFVMAGSYFAGHEETGLVFHGMSSDRSRKNRKQKILDYRASEGREVKLQSKGRLEDTLRDLTGGIRSACTYLGVENIDELTQTDIRAIRVNRQLNPITGVIQEN